MHHFDYRDSELYCEEVPVAAIAAKIGTPFYLYSHATLTRHFNKFDGAFEGVDRLICFSAKANTNLAVLKLFADLGCGLDIVSGGELYRGLKAGFSPERIVYSGVGKRVDEIDYALETGILVFNIESFDELRLISERAGVMNRKASIAIRVNPNVDPKTHPYISTGLKKNKFGIENESAFEAYQTASRLENIEIVGIDCHIGSQITDVKPFEDALLSLRQLISRLNNELNIAIKYVDMGGGLGITYSTESPPLLSEYANAIRKHLEDTDSKLILEPGRVFVGNAGILVTRVLSTKSSADKNFVIIDAGMNDLMRPALYGAFHTIQPVLKSEEGSFKADVVGPICESSDFLAQDRELAKVKNGDLLAVMSSGAYGFVMSSNYCSRLRVAEVMVKGNQFEVVTVRERYEDLVEKERIPAFLQGKAN